MGKPADPIAKADAALDDVVRIQAQIERLMAVRAEKLVTFRSAFDEAYPFPPGSMRSRARAAELACALTIPDRTAERILGEAHELTQQFPATVAAIKNGRASYRHAMVIVEQASGLNPDDAAELEAAVLERASRLTVSKFRRAVRTVSERRHPETMVKRCQEAFDERNIRLDPASDGMAYLSAYLGQVEAQAIYFRLTSCAEGLRQAGDPRTLEQLRTDAFVDVLLDRPAGVQGRFAGIRPTIIATVPAVTLVGASVEPGTLEGMGPIDAETARRLTAEAPSLYRLLTHPQTGVALSLDRTTDRLSEGLRMWLRLRDGSCLYPTCSISTGRSDIYHTRDWGRTGPSNHDNLAHLSRGHHTLKHRGGWTVRQVEPGHLVWTSYLGRRYDVWAENARPDQPPRGSPKIGKMTDSEGDRAA